MTNTERIQENNAELREAIEMAESLPDAGGVEPIIEPLEINENGTYTVPDGVDGYSPVTVDVPIPDGYIQPSGTLEVTENGTKDVTAYASVNVNVPTGGGGDTSIEDGLITRTLTEYENDRVTSVGAYAFYNWTNLQSFDLPNAKTIGTQAFYNCDKLASVYLPAATSVGDNSFRGCAALTSVDCPSLTSVGTTAFRECAKLTDLNLPNVKTIGNYAFHSCTALKRIDLPSITSIATQVFANCSALALIIIRTESGVCSVSSIASFQGTPFASGGTGGVVLVPRAVVDSYKTTGQWKTLYGYGTNEILALEDFTVDGTITGELDETKLEQLVATRSASMALNSTYFNQGTMIEYEGVDYDEAIDPAELNRQDTETDEPIGGETDEPVE